MSCEDVCEGINPSENSKCTLNSQSACRRSEEGKMSQNQYSSTASAENSNCSWKPPVAPKPRHSNISKSYKSSSSEILPTTPSHQVLPQSNNETDLKNGQDTCDGLTCAPHRQVQRSNIAMHPNRVLVLPLPHPGIQLLPLSPPKLPPRLRSTPSSGIHHRPHTMIENAKRPPVPPKPKNIPRLSQSPGKLQARSEHSLTLTQLANSYSQSFPVQVEVLQGFYGQTRNQTFNNNETYSIVCPKHAGHPQCPPRSSSWSRSRSLTYKALPKQLQSEEYTLPVSLSKEEQCVVTLGAHSQVASYISPPSTSKVEEVCTAYRTESDCASVELFPGGHETNKSKSRIPMQHLGVDSPLQQMQEQIKSLQKQVSSLMVRTKDDLSSTEKGQEPTDPTPASGDNRLQYSDLKYVMQTLCDLSTWYLLGVYLDVPKGKLDQFHATYSGGPDAVERCKIETICYWLENARKPTWAQLAAAVLAMGRKGIVEKISKRFGVRLPIREEREQYETMLVVLPEQGPIMKTLQKEMELKDQEFCQVEQKQGQLEERLRNLQSELNAVRDLLHFNERLTRKLITDGQRIKSDLSTSMSKESSYVRNQSFTMYRKRDRISSLRKEQEHSSLKLEEAQKEQRELWEKLHNLESKIVMTSQELRLLQTQQQSAKAALQLQELAINETLVSRTEHQYYNIVIQDGKVEMKLTQQQVETLHRKIADENLKVKQLREQLEFHQQKLQEVTSQNELLNRESQAAAQLEKHQRAYLESTLEANIMQCQIEISTTEYHKQQMESHIHMLRSKMTNLKKRQRQYEQVVIQQKSSSPSGKNTDLPYRPQFHSVSQKPHCSYEEVAFDCPSSTESHIHHFQRSHNTHSGNTTPVLGYRAMPTSTSWEQHPPFTTPFIPTPHAPLLRNRSLNESHRKPHPPLQRFPSAIPYFSHPPYTATKRSAEEDYAGQQPDVIERFDKMGEVENGSKGDSVLNGVIYEPKENYSSREYNLLQKAEYLPSNNYDSDQYEAVHGWYSETHFTQPSYHDLAHQLPSHPPKSCKNGYCRLQVHYLNSDGVTSN